MLNRRLTSRQSRSGLFSGEIKIDRSGIHQGETLITVSTDDTNLEVHLQSFVPQPDEREIARRVFRALTEKLCKEHPAISMDAEVLGGTPHVTNTRLSVGKVLSKLYLYGSIQAIVEIHEPHLSEAQVKEAIAYAQDFLEIACDPHETP